MVEISQIRAEEAKWTPKSVYDILPPNALKFDGFDYLEGGDGVDKEKAQKSLLDGVSGWFRNLISITGRIIGGAIELGVGVFKAVADGIQSFLGGIGRIFKSIFGGDQPPTEPIFSPIHADLEAAVRPHLDTIKKNSQEIAKSIEDIGTLKTEMQEVLGDVTKISEDAAKAIDDASAALSEAEAATAHADSLNSERIAAEELIKSSIQTAISKADTAKTAADGKSTNFYGPTQPETGKPGDTWFKTDENGKTTIYQFVEKPDGASGWVASYNQSAIDLAIDSKVATSDYQKKMSAISGDLATVRDSVDMARAEALAAGLLTPGNLVYNPKFETDKAGKVIGWNFITLHPQRFAAGGYRDAYVSVTYPAVDTGSEQAIYNTEPEHKFTSPAAAGRTFKLTVYVRPKVLLPSGALRGQAFGGSSENSPEFPANVWTKWVVTSKFTDDPTTHNGTWLSISRGPAMSAGATVDFSEPEMAEAADNWLIVDGSVKMGKLASDSVDASKIVAGSITTRELGADSVTARQIQSNSVTADELAARSVQATHLMVAPGNMTYNPTFTNDGEGWSLANCTVTWDKDPSTNSGKATVVTKTTGDATIFNANQLKNGAQVAPGQSLRISMSVTSTTDTTGMQLWCGAFFYDATGKYKATVGNFAGKDVPANTATRVSTIIKVPEGCYIALTRLWFKANTGTYTVQNPIMCEAVDSSLVVAGSITADAIAASSINTRHIGADQIRAENIDSGAITAKHISSDVVDARMIKAEVFTQVGSSVLPLIPGTTKGAWTDQAASYASDATLTTNGAGPSYKFTGASMPTKTNMVAVDPNAEYDLEVWLRSPSGSLFDVALLDQDDKNAVLSGGLNNNAERVSPVATVTTDSDGIESTTWVNKQTYTSGLISMNLPSQWRKYTSRVKLRPGVRFIRIGRISTSGTCFVGDLNLRVHIVPQAEVDANQNNAIKKNTVLGTKNLTAIQGLFRGIEGLERALAVQDEINAAQNKINEMLRANDENFLSIQRENMKVVSRLIVAKAGETISNDHILLDPGRGKVTFKPGWSGECVISWGKTGSSGMEVYVERYSWRGSSQYGWTPPGGSWAISRADWIRVDYQVEPGVQKSVDMTNTNPLMTAGVANSWVTMSQHNATATAGHYLEYRLTLRAANRGTRYGIRFLVNGVEKAIFSDDAIGPLTPLGTGEIPISLSKNIPDIKRGDKIEMQTFVGSTSGAWDECFAQFGRITFVDPEG